MKNKKRILIIGGLGFIGKNLYRKCKQLDHSVSILSEVSVDGADPFAKEVDPEDVVIGDIKNPDSLRIIKEQSAIYLLAGLSGAAGSIHDPYNDVKTNLIGHLNVLEACRSLNPDAVVFFPSSRLVYGKPQYNPVDEKHPLDPESIYAIHKLTAEYYCELYHKIYNMRTIVFRISNPYGPYQLFGGKNYGILNWFIYNALKGIEIEIFGRGDQKRDYIYIDDLTELMISSVDDPALYGGIFNVGSGRGISIHDAVETLKTIIPDLKYKYVEWPEIERKIETGDYISDIGRIAALTGWSPKVSFKDGIASTVEYYRKHFK
jgi:UDP-glucose 4-epimerase